MILISAGEFLMGSDPQHDKYTQDYEHPQHRLYLPAYYLAKTPVTNAQYKEFVQATGHQVPDGWTNRAPPRGEEDHPVVNVSRDDTIEYCQWLTEVTGRNYGLPSEAEWEKAARGTDGRIYPWGDQWDATRCNTWKRGTERTTSVHAYPQGTNPYGAEDMAGNVWEWTRSLWGEYPYPTEQREQTWRENLKAPRTTARVLRGGGFHLNQWHVRCAGRLGYLPDGSGSDVGFRVVVRPAP
jgi:formylglycine-generating enzyme required for sulfatase activity